MWEVKSLPMEKISHKILISCVSTWQFWLNAPRAQVHSQLTTWNLWPSRQIAAHYSQSHLESDTNRGGLELSTALLTGSCFWLSLWAQEDQGRVSREGVLGLLRTPVLMEVGMHTWLRASLATLTPLHLWRPSMDCFEGPLFQLLALSSVPMQEFQTLPGFLTAFRIKSTFLNRIYKVDGFPGQDHFPRSTLLPPSLRTQNWVDPISSFRSHWMKSPPFV